MSFAISSSSSPDINTSAIFSENLSHIPSIFLRTMPLIGVVPIIILHSPPPAPRKQSAKSSRFSFNSFSAGNFFKMSFSSGLCTWAKTPLKAHPMTPFFRISFPKSEKDFGHLSSSQALLVNSVERSKLCAFWKTSSAATMPRLALTATLNWRAQTFSVLRKLTLTWPVVKKSAKLACLALNCGYRSESFGICGARTGGAGGGRETFEINTQLVWPTEVSFEQHETQNLQRSSTMRPWYLFCESVMALHVDP
mmetsp:Transcript_46587/g.122299  ORF Transcript_46587/g.122299 Transcript_46587/m.122299 type:complete len:252 (-) Transcript_46587:1609-2364(-)